MLDTVADVSSRVVVVGFVISMVAGLPILALRRLNWEKTDQAFKPLFEKLRLFQEPQPGTVRVTYTVYQGVLFWVTHTTITVHGPIEDIGIFLWRCLWFSLSRGILAHGGLLIPFVLLPSLWIQLRSVRHQSTELNKEEQGAWPALSDAHFDEVASVTAEEYLLPWGAIIQAIIAAVIGIALILKVITAYAMRDTADLSMYVWFGIIGVAIWSGLTFMTNLTR